MKKISVLSPIIFSCVVVLTSGGWAQAPTDGLIAHYTFDSSYTDLTGSGLAATPFNQVSFTLDTQLGRNVLSIVGEGFLNANGGYVRIPRPAGLTSIGTVSIYIKEYGYSQWHGQAVISLGNIGLVGYQWFLSGDTGLHAFNQLIKPGVPPFSGDTGVLYVEPAWTSYQIVSSSTGSTVYRNGEPIASVPDSFESSGDIYLGYNLFEGQTITRVIADVADVRIYSRALSGQEVQQLAAALVDSDGDNVNDYREEKDGTDPNDPNSFNPLSKGLVAYYPFNGNANDESGNQNNLNLLNAVFGSDRFGDSSSAMLNQNGTGVVAASTSPISITGNSSRTIAFWAKVPNPNNGESLGVGWGTNENTGNGSQLSVFGDGRAYFWGSWADVQTEFPKGEWAHLSFTYDGSFRSAKFFVNGVAKDVVGSGIWDTPLDTKATIIRIAAWTMQSGVQTLSEALIDDIRIYNRALSASEIADLYQNENNPDTDGDGLTNRLEIELGTDPNNPDTDGDGLKDGVEYLLAELGFNPLVSNASQVASLFVNPNNALLYTRDQYDTFGAARFTDGVNSVLGIIPSIDVALPQSTTLRLTLGGSNVTSVVLDDTQSSLPSTWSLDEQQGQLVGTISGTNTISFVLEGEMTGGSPTLRIPFNFYPQRAQTIAAFRAIPAQTFSYTPLTIALPAAGSGLPAVLSVKSGPATVTASNQVTFTGSGRVALAANHPGNTNFSAAREVTTSFVVNKGRQTINFPAPNSVPFVRGNTFPIEASATSGLPVAFRSSGTNVITISGSTATIVGKGTATITATQPGDARWLPAPAVNRTITVF